MKKLLSKFLILSLLLAALSNVYAQEDAAGGEGDDLTAATEQHVYTVVGFALFGAILGLSTLSFEETPHEHYDNITMGTAIGTILGVGVVAYFQADQSKGYLTGEAEEEEEELVEFSSKQRRAWHYESQQFENPNRKELKQINFSFNF